MDNSLERGIATALAATEVSSTDLSRILVEAEAAIAAADETAELERVKALDPMLSPDAKVARQVMEDALFMRDRLKTLLPRLQTKHKEVADAEALAAWMAEANELEERRFALGAEFRKVFSQLIDDIVDRLWAMRDLDQEILALNNRRPIEVANAAGVRFLDFVTPAFAEYLKIPDPDVGSKHWEIGTSGTGYLWPPRQLTPGQQLAHAMMAGTYPRTPSIGGIGTRRWRSGTAACWRTTENRSPRPSSASASARSAKPPKPARNKRLSEQPTMPSLAGRRDGTKITAEVIE